MLSCSQKATDFSPWMNGLRAGFCPTGGKNLVPRALARGAPLAIAKRSVLVLMIVFIFISVGDFHVVYADISGDEKSAIDKASGETRFQYFYKTGKEWHESSYEDRQNFFKKTKEAKQALNAHKRQLEQNKQEQKRKLEDRKRALQQQKQESLRKRQQIEQKRQQENQQRQQRLQQNRQKLQQRRSRTQQ